MTELEKATERLKEAEAQTARAMKAHSDLLRSNAIQREAWAQERKRFQDGLATVTLIATLALFGATIVLLLMWWNL